VSYDQAREGLATHGVVLPPYPQRRYLGGGAHASVYEADGNLAVKITDDLSERYAALLVRDNPQPGLVRVDHVFAMPNEWRHNHVTVIVCELLAPLPDGFAAQWFAARPYHLGPAYPSDLRRVEMEAWPVRVTQTARAIHRGLDAAGIFGCTDCHEHNLMMRPSTGEIVLADLGCSESPRSPVTLLYSPGTVGPVYLDETETSRPPEGIPGFSTVTF
jgi:hypothetical protein